MPKGKVTALRFRKLFDNGEPIDAIAWLKAASSIIVEEIGKEINGKPNKLIALAEYLAANLKPGPRAFEINRLLRDAYGFVGRYEDAWQAVLKNQPQSAIEYFRFFRKVIPELTIPTAILTLNRSRYWQGEDRTRLNKILDDLIRQFEAMTGIPLFEYYCRITDTVFLTVESETGISFEDFRAYMPGLRNVSEQRRLREIVPAMGEALGHGLMSVSEDLAKDLDQPETLTEKITEAVRHQRAEWKRGYFWERMELLYNYVYDYWRLSSPRFDIHDFYLKGRCLRVPVSPSILRMAIDRKISNLWREAENILRTQKGMPKIGEGWSSEATLVSHLREAFPNTIIETQARPSWLGRMRLDAYFPEFRIAVEYQGVQHNRAVTLFGGQSGLVTTQTRDTLKRKLCDENGCRLVDVFPGYDVTVVIAQIRLLMAAATRIEVLRQDKKPTRRKPKGLILPPEKPMKIKLSALGAHDVNECARYGTGELIRSLAGTGTNFENRQRNKQDSLIFIAASAGNLDTLRAFLDLGLDVNAENCQRKATALARLCNGKDDNPNLDAVRMLLEAGADVRKSAKGYVIHDCCAYAPPLIGAAIACNIPLAELLLEYGARVNARHKESGHTPFTATCGRVHCSISKSEKRLNMLRWLISKGANPRARNSRGQSAFNIAVEIFHERQVDFALYSYLMKLGVPLDLDNAYQLRREYEIAPTPQLKKIIDYAKLSGTGKAGRKRRKIKKKTPRSVHVVT